MGYTFGVHIMFVNVVALQMEGEVLWMVEN